MYSFPSTSHSREPSARSTKKGSPPTPRKARTGEFTPPGVMSQARRKSVRLFALRSAAGGLAALLPCAALSELVMLSSKKDFSDDEALLDPAPGWPDGRRHRGVQRQRRRP